MCPDTNLHDVVQACLDDDRDYRFRLVDLVIGDDEAFITVAFKDEQLDMEVQSDLWAAGMPISDWDNPTADTGPGSLTYQYAEGTALLFNREYLTDVLLDRHGEAIRALIAEYADVDVALFPRPYYTVAALMPSYNRLKTQHVRRLRTGRPPRR